MTYDVIARDHGGTYVAAGNGPYASVAYRTTQSIVVYDLPFGYIAAVTGTTGVLLVVEDHGRNRH